MNSITASDFKTTIFDFSNGASYSGDKPVVIDFYADWCAPCKMVMPVLSQFSRENQDVNFYKVNVDTEPELASHFGVSSVPTILFIGTNGEIDPVVGVMPPYELKKKIASLQ